MPINPITNTSGPNVYKKFTPKTTTTQPEMSTQFPAQNNASNSGKILLIGTTLLAISGIAFYALTRKPQKTLDTKYKEKLIESLKAENINVSAEALKSIAGPEELSGLLKKFKPEHFQAGLQTLRTDIPVETFYANAIKGNFRVSLHTHSNFSDGKATAAEFLECARKYADKVAKTHPKDGLPPFTIALTDHDCVDGCKEIIKLIAREPDKYKNLKFVAGCEFSVRNGHKHHDITGLALNPFSKRINRILNEIKQERRQSVQKFLDKKNKENGTNITLEQLKEAEKQDYIKRGKAGKHCIENGSGVVAVRHAVQFYHKVTNTPLNREELNRLGTANLLPIELVVGTINKTGALASLTHPLKSFWSYIGDAELLRLKNMGVSGIEVNHQYTPSKMQEIAQKSGYFSNPNNAHGDLTQKYKNFAKEHDMFLSGGTDCHEKQIFSREPKITQEILDKILN